MEQNKLDLSHVLTEKETQDFLGLSKEGLSHLRHTERLPFIKVTSRLRLYSVTSLIGWLMNRETVLNRE